jgi:hypothetical protein
MRYCSCAFIGFEHSIQVFSATGGAMMLGKSSCIPSAISIGVGMMEPSGGGAAAEKAGGGGGRGSSTTEGFVAADELAIVEAGVSQPSGISVIGGGKVVVMGCAGGATCPGASGGSAGFAIGVTTAAG